MHLEVVGSGGVGQRSILGNRKRKEDRERERGEREEKKREETVMLV